MNDYVGVFLQQLPGLAPLLLVCVVGIVAALMRWPRHPLASLLVLVGLGVLFLNWTAGTLVWAMLLAEWRTMPDGRNWLDAFGILRSAVSAGGIALVTLAVFVGRFDPNADRRWVPPPRLE